MMISSMSRYQNTVEFPGGDVRLGKLVRVCYQRPLLPGRRAAGMGSRTDQAMKNVRVKSSLLVQSRLKLFLCGVTESVADAAIVHLRWTRQYRALPPDCTSLENMP
jgi:hypothetical protein